MRKIEIEMNAAVRARKDWRKANTTVFTTADGTQTTVRLHGNVICRINNHTGQRQFFTQGWHTATTKSRLNALGADLRIRDFSLINRDGTPFREGQSTY